MQSLNRPSRVLGFYQRLERGVRAIAVIFVILLIAMQIALSFPRVRERLCPVVRWEGRPLEEWDRLSQTP